MSRTDESLKPLKSGPVRIRSTITIPREWLPKIQEFMRSKGFQDYAELFRYLIRKEIIGE